MRYLCAISRIKTGNHGQEYSERGYSRQSTGSPKIQGYSAYFGDTHPAISVISTQCFY
jgi:hypothetical protein